MMRGQGRAGDIIGVEVGAMGLVDVAGGRGGRKNRHRTGGEYNNRNDPELSEAVALSES